MPTTLNAYRLFIASPGGLLDVRECFRAVIEKYNTEDAVRRGALFIPVGWELTMGGMGRPQAIINREIEECDAFFLVLYDRWGTNPGAPEGYTSGTEEEFNKALEFLADPTKPMRDLYVFFKTVEPARLSDPGEQLKAVLSFKKGLEQEKKLLFHQFDNPAEFEGALRMFLASWVRRHEEESSQRAAVGAEDEAGANIEVPPDDKHDRSGFAGVEGAVEAQPRLATESPDDPPPEADTPLGNAAVLAAQGRLTEAETVYAQLTAANNDAAAAFEYGQFLFRLGRKMQAEEFLRRAGDVARIAGEGEWIARSSAALGRLLASKGDYDKGAAALDEAASLFEGLEDFAELAAARLRLGDILLHQNLVPEARDAYEAALDALQKDYTPDIAADIHAAVGQLHHELGDFSAAAKSFEKATSLKNEIQSTTDLADTYAGYGAVLEKLENFEAAKAAYTRSLELFDEEKNFSGIADISDHLGRVHLALGEEEEAEAAFDRSAGVFETVQNFDGAVDAYTSLGKIQIKRGRAEEAAASFRQALALVSRIKNKEEVAEIYESLEHLIAR